MPGRQAKIITPTMLRRMLGAVANRRTTSRDRVIILLSAKAGLREIARLDWSMALDARGRVGDCLAVRDAIAKKRGGRRIPMHPSLGRALVALKRGSTPLGPGVRSVRGGGMRGRPASSTGSPLSSPGWSLRAARRIQVGGRSLPPRRETHTRPAAACATCNCWRATSRSRSRRAISTATQARSGGWSRRSSSRDAGVRGDATPAPSRREHR
jgi:integrase